MDLFKQADPAADFNLAFDEWMHRVDAEIGRRTGLSSADLPDCNYRDWFDDGYTVREAAQEAIENAE